MRTVDNKIVMKVHNLTSTCIDITICYCEDVKLIRRCLATGFLIDLVARVLASVPTSGIECCVFFVCAPAIPPRGTCQECFQPS